MAIPYKAVALLSAFILICSISLGWIGFPILFKSLIKKKINLMPETPTRAAWQAFPLPFEFAIHVFNVTNPSEVEEGRTPIVKDVGPFVFDEFKDKYDLLDNDEDDTVSFNMRNTFIFQADRSKGLTGEELITMPHPIIQMMSISVKRQSADMIAGVGAGLGIVFKNASPFITAPFMDLFFRGIFIDCSSEHPAAKAVCGQFESGAIRGANKFNDTHFKFSLMGANNHSDAGRFTVLRGRKKSKDIGKVLQFNGKGMLDVWPGYECNQFKGTDGTVFPPFSDPQLGLWSFSPDLCRSMSPKMRRSVHYNGLPAVRFVMDFGDIRNEKGNNCYCRSYPEICPAKGTMDLSPCTKTPMIASMPHFLHGDENLLKNVGGLQPNDGLHGTHIDFESISGTPLSVYKRVQFNLDVEAVAEVAGMKNLQSIVMPLFWIDENINLIPAITDTLKGIFKTLMIKDIAKWVALVVSIFGFAFAIFLYNKQRIRNPISLSTE